MLSIRSITFGSDDTADVVMSRLDWKVTKVKRLTNPWFNHSTADTSRAWVGKIDKEKREFEIIQTAPYLSPRIVEGNFFRLPVHGQIIDNGENSTIMITFRLGLAAFLFFVFIYLLPFLITILFIKAGRHDWAWPLFSFAIPILLTLLLIRQLNRTENKLIELFEV